MQRIILTSLLFWMMSIASIVAQDMPQWCKHDMRRHIYPDNKFFIGYVEGDALDNENQDVAIQRLKDAARVEAVSIIRTFVQTSTTNQSLSETIRCSNDTLRESMRSLTSTASTQDNLEIYGLQVESWCNPETGRIHAFAYVSKANLSSLLKNQITLALAKAEMAVDLVEQLMAIGQKELVRAKVEETLPLFAIVEEIQQLLVTVDADATAKTLKLSETRQLQQRLIALITQVEDDTISIFIKCDAHTFSSPYPALQLSIKGQLSQLGCDFVSNRSDADWVIEIQSQAREYNVITYDTGKQYVVYVDANISITKTATKKCIYENIFSQKGIHTFSSEQAAMEAYKNLTPKICEAIKEIVQR